VFCKFKVIKNTCLLISSKDCDPMVEPDQLLRGKLFQNQVRVAWEEPGEPLYRFEQDVTHKLKRGRADIVIYGNGRFCAVLEIKATDWDRIKVGNVNKNLWRHQNQLLRYIDKFLESDKLNVCPGIVYPRPPRKKGLRQHIECYLEDRGIPAYWFSEIS